jgi:hypothetical protein
MVCASIDSSRLSFGTPGRIRAQDDACAVLDDVDRRHQTASSLRECVFRS